MYQSEYYSKFHSPNKLQIVLVGKRHFAFVTKMLESPLQVLELNKPPGLKDLTWVPVETSGEAPNTGLFVTSNSNLSVVDNSIYLFISFTLLYILDTETMVWSCHNLTDLSGQLSPVSNQYMYYNQYYNQMVNPYSGYEGFYPTPNYPFAMAYPNSTRVNSLQPNLTIPSQQYQNVQQQFYRPSNEGMYVDSQQPVDMYQVPQVPNWQMYDRDRVPLYATNGKKSSSRNWNKRKPNGRDQRDPKDRDNDPKEVQRHPIEKTKE